jgi:hypothetical protein
MMFRIVFWDVLQYAPLKRRSTIILHGSTSQKTVLNINCVTAHYAVCVEKRNHICTKAKTVSLHATEALGGRG